MRNSSDWSWDGPANLLAAVRVAGDAQARGLGWVIAMSEKIIAANEVTKTHTESVDTFQSRDFGALGMIDKDRAERPLVVPQSAKILLLPKSKNALKLSRLPRVVMGSLLILPWSRERAEL